MSIDPTIAARFCLGTAQLGIDYGVANVHGRPDDQACDRLLSLAIERGVTVWDTARSYGDAEQRIGCFLKRCPNRDSVRIVSKVSMPPSYETKLIPWIGNEIDASRCALGVEQLEAWLVHDASMIADRGDELWDAMQAQVDRGATRSTGASVYDVTESRAVLARWHCTTIQVPMNLLDARFVVDGQLRVCEQNGVTVFARSAMLQGVFALSPPDMPQRLLHLRGPLQRLWDLLDEQDLRPLDVALPFVLSHPGVDFVVVGVDNAAQLEDNLARAEAALPYGLAMRLQQAFSNLDVDVLEPRRWLEIR